MRDPYQVLREKQMELLKLRKETAALRLVLSMIEDENTPTIEGSVAPLAGEGKASEMQVH
jgi:hypothetical protein